MTSAVVAPVQEVFVLGAGRAGLALARAILRAGHTLVGTWNRGPEAAARVRAVTGAPAFHGRIPQVVRSASLVLLGVADDALAPVARQLVREGLVGDGMVVAHLAGALDSTLLAGVARLGAAVGSLHPVASFSEGTTLPLGTRFGVEGDPLAVRTLRFLVEQLGGHSVVIDPGQKPRYHAALVFAANYAVVVAHVAREQLAQAGVPPDEAMRMLSPLIESTARNISREGTVAALTGPVSRGDISTVKLHLAALGTDPALVRLYARLGLRAVDLAVEQGLSTEDAVAMRTLFEASLKAD